MQGWREQNEVQATLTHNTENTWQYLRSKAMCCVHITFATHNLFTVILNEYSRCKVGHNKEEIVKRKKSVQLFWVEKFPYKSEQV